jgi:hypothetical protein
MRPDRYLIPAGKCPAELTGTDRETVEAWMDAVQAAYGDPVEDPEKRCGSSTFVYYAQQFYPRFGVGWDGDGAEYSEVRGHIRESFGLPREPTRTAPAPSKAAPPPPGKPKRRKAAPPPPKPKTAAQLAADATRGAWGKVKSDTEVLEAERARPRRKAPPPPPKK